jgi:hypothetical protein
MKRRRVRMSRLVCLPVVPFAIGCSASDGNGTPVAVSGAAAGGSTSRLAPGATPGGAPSSDVGNFPDFGAVDDAPSSVPTLTPSRCSMEGKPKTTVSSTIYDPAGRLPLYNVMVYVPSAPLDPLVEGVSCDRCDATASGRPVASALTDPSGRFVLEDVPDGQQIPLVIQMGKWRRQISLPEVRPCQNNEFDDPDEFRLPRDQSEGHLPKIAMVTGRADKLECMMRVIGIADSEFTRPEGSGRVNLYAEAFGATASFAAGEAFPPAADLIGSLETLSNYDLVIMSCHGESRAIGRAQPTSQKEAVKAYVDRGGRVFGSHFHYSYLRSDDDNHFPTPFPDVGAWDGDASHTVFDIETGFPKGRAFAEWLVSVGASEQLGSIELVGVEGSASRLDTPYTQSWISAENSVPYFSMNMPVEKLATPDEQCGRFVHTGIHVANGDEDPFPAGCEDRELTPQEKAFEFLIFDLSACPARFDIPPAPPAVFNPR